MRLLQRLPLRCFGAAGVLAGLVLLFLAGLRDGGGPSCLSSAALLQDYPLTRVEPPPRARGLPRPDALARSEPWTIFEGAELAEGRVPLWNPWNAAGCPHLARSGTTAFSPFAIPLHLMGPRAGGLASAAMQLFALGFFAFLFLRELRACTLAAIVGATSFAFAGSQLFALGTMRAGALATLPAVLFFAEKALRRVQAVVLGTPGEHRLSARVRAPLAGLCLALVAGSLCGDPGAVALALGLLAAWIGARVLPLVLEARSSGRSLRPLASFGAKVAVALVLAAGIRAFEVLPWLELLRHGSSVPDLAHEAAPLRWGPWPLLFFPRGAGEPRNLEELSAYTGGIVLFLALLSLAFARRDPRIPWFLALGVICLAAASGAAPLFRNLAGWGLAPEERGQGGYAFCLACAGALAVDHIPARGVPLRWSRATLTAAGGALFFTLFRLGMEGFVSDASVAPHLRHMAEIFAAGLVAVCLLWVAPGLRVRLLAGAALVGAIFLGTGPGIADLLPRCEERACFPRTPELRKLQAKVGQERVLILGEPALPSDANLACGLAVLTSQGGLAVEEFARLFQASFGGADAAGPVESFSGRGLATFGVPWVLARDSSDLARTHPGELALAERIGDLGLYRYGRSRGKTWLVRGSVHAATFREALDRVSADSFDPALTVVLGPGAERNAATPPAEGPERGASDTAARIVEETPTWVRIEADCGEAEFLVVAQTWYPGWKARVNGVERPLERANYAFSCVELQRGLNVVDLSYEPDSLRTGLWIGLGCVLCGLLCLFHRATA